jgi:hypothetical protein
MVSQNININANLEGNLEKKLTRINKKTLRLEKSVVRAGKQISGLSKTKKDLEVVAQKFKLQSKQVSILTREARMLTRQLDNMKLSATQAVVPLGNLGKSLNFRRNSQGLLDFNGDMLSLMFLGMAFQGVFTSALSAIFDGYKKIIPENSAFNREVTKLTANFEFFKFQLADAFANSTLFTVLADSANSLLKMFQGLSPEMKNFVVIGLGVGVVASAFLAWLGIVSLGVASLVNLKKKSTSWMSVFGKGNPSEMFFTWLTTTVKNFSFKGLIDKLKVFAGSPISTIGDFFKSVKTKLTTFLKTVFKGGLLESAKRVFTGFNVQGLKAFKNIITGFKSLFKLSPFGWILIAIQSLFETFQDVGERTFSSTTTKVIGFVVSLIINVIENVVQAFAELVDIIMNVIAYAIEKAAGAFGIDIDIPTIDLGGMVDNLGTQLNDWALDFISEKTAEAKAKDETKSNTTNNVYYVGDAGAAEETRAIAEQQTGNDILAVASR